jgi:hypothetical protein
LRVPRGGFSGAPRLVERYLGRHLLEAFLYLSDVGECVGGQGEVVPTVAFHGATHGQQVLTFQVRRVHTHL